MTWRTRLGAAAAAALVAACGGGSGTTGAEVLVSAAASLSGAFSEIEAAFEAQHPAVDVVMNHAGSSALREQIIAGAPVDVFASADISNMERVAAAGELSGAPQVFARNRLQIAVPAGNPAGVEGLADFSEEGLLIGLCAVAVPCGELARRALAAAGISPAIDTDEPDVRALLTKVALGELDAGIVYVTDVLSTEEVDGIAVPPAIDVVAVYPIAVLAAADNSEAASAFVEFVLSDAGQGILAAHGFEPS